MGENFFIGYAACGKIGSGALRMPAAAAVP